MHVSIQLTRACKFALALSPLLIAGNKSIAQSCPELTVGQKMKVEVNTYPLAHEHFGNDFISMKTKKKLEKGAEYNAELMAGKVKPSSTYTLDYAVTGVDGDGAYELTTNIAGMNYSSYTKCKDGNLYLIRVKGNLNPVVLQNDTIGFNTMGVQIVPVDLKVGDVLPGYVDESVMSMHTKAHWNSTFAVSDAGYSHYGHVPAVVNYDVTGKLLTLYQGGQVVGEESLTVSGKTYKCYRVRTEIWKKNDTKTDVKVELDTWFNDPGLSKKIQGQVQSVSESVADKLAINMDKMAGVNKAGYVVAYKEEWIYPALGVLKSNNFDQWGCLTTTMTVTGIE